jgi:hypothetical protein
METLPSGTIAALVLFSAITGALFASLLTCGMRSRWSNTKRHNCSFCGRSSDDAGRMIEGQDRVHIRRTVRICQECARLAIDIFDQESLRRGEAKLRAE